MVFLQHHAKNLTVNKPNFLFLKLTIQKYQAARTKLIHKQWLIQILICRICKKKFGVKHERKGVNLPKIYGCTTAGDDWQFLELSDKLYIDSKNII